MKCPKCGYLGFDTGDRCRNCGYDFSLSLTGEQPPAELPLHGTNEEAPVDFDLSQLDTSRPQENIEGLDLDKVFEGAMTPTTVLASEMARGRPPRREPRPPAAPVKTEPLPLFSEDPPAEGEAPLIPAPRPPRPPLAVRRSTPELTRTRPPLRPGAMAGRQPVPPRPDTQGPRAGIGDAATVPAAPAGARLLGAVIDLGILVVIDVAVIYFTLAIAGLELHEIGVVPRVPLAAFLLLVDGGYLLGFTAANGQTIGKMAAGIRVIGDDGQRIDWKGAVLRTIGCSLSALTLGIGYLPAFVTEDRRALHDRIAGTRVVEAA